MGKLFCIIGKDASGRDTVFKGLISDPDLGLRPVIPYTARPPKPGEAAEGRWHFVTEDTMRGMKRAGKILERHCCDTEDGAWDCFTVDDGGIGLPDSICLTVGTLESFWKLRALGTFDVVPVYIETDDYNRLRRALQREAERETPSYAGLCRRFISGQHEFTEESLAEAGITDAYRFSNDTDGNPGQCIQKVKTFIQKGGTI